MTFHLMPVNNTFCSFWIAELPPFGKKLPTRLAVCSHCILSIFNLTNFPFWFVRGVCFFIVPVPVHCLIVFIM